MEGRKFSRRDAIELTAVLATYVAVTIIAFWTSMRIEWIWRVPQVLLPVTLVLARRESLTELGLTKENLFRNLEFGILVAALLAAATAPLYLEIFPVIMPASLYPDVWLWVTIFALVNVFAIEIFYRGCLQTKLTAVVGFLPGLAATSLLCGLDFFEFKVFGPVIAVIAALVFGLLYHRTRSLAATATAHILWILFVMAASAS